MKSNMAKNSIQIITIIEILMKKKKKNLLIKT